MNTLWHTLSISIRHGNHLSFITLLSWLFSTLLAASHSFKASSSAASSVSAAVSGISTFGSGSDLLSFAAFQASAFVAASNSFSFTVMLVSINLRNCSGLAWEWSTAVWTFTASSPCYWLAAHDVIFWTYMWWTDTIELMFKYVSLSYFNIRI